VTWSFENIGISANQVKSKICVTLELCGLKNWRIVEVQKMSMNLGLLDSVRFLPTVVQPKGVSAFFTKV